MSGPAILLDTETTDRDEGREIIEAAWIRPTGVVDLAGPSEGIPRPLLHYIADRFERRYQPTKPISFGAMAVHHILPSELEGEWPSETFSLPDDVQYIIGHNIDFDWQAAGSPPHVKRICTDAMARYVWQDCDAYSQSALLYRLLGPTPETRKLLQGAHSALTDVMNNARLLEEILSETGITTWSALHEYSEQCRIPLRMPITKARGELLTDIDDGLLSWCLNQSWLPAEHPYLHKGLMLERERREKEWREQYQARRNQCE